MTETTRALLIMLVGLLLLVGVAAAAGVVNGDDPGDVDVVRVAAR